MKLGELLSPARVVVPLEARDVREATMLLARALIASGAVADEEKFARLLKSDWPEDTVAVEGKAFLPHFRSDAFRYLALALGVTPAPVRRRSGDSHQRARIVALIVAPVGEASAYLRAMAALATALQSDEILAAMLAAGDAASLLAIPGLAEATLPEDVIVANLMSTDVTAVGPETPLGEAARLMLARAVRALPIIGPNREVLGLITDGHLMRHLLPATVTALSTGQTRAVSRRGKGRATPPPEDPAATPVREVMDRSVLCLAEDQTIGDVAALMLSKELSRFPVTRDGALVGFLSRGDIVRKLLGS